MNDETVVAEAGWVRALMWLGFPAVGAGLGWLLLQLVELAVGARLPIMGGPFRLVDSIPEPQSWIGALAAGAVVGLVVAGIGEAKALTVSLRHHDVTLSRGGTAKTVRRDAFDAVFVDGKALVLLAPDGGEVARERSDLDKGRLAEAFRKHGYRWLDDGDPHNAEYRRWVRDDPDLPGAADAFLRARAHAIDKGEAGDAAELRDELVRLGVVVRDERRRQYWRASGR
jgi:hypothetical protein